MHRRLDAQPSGRDHSWRCSRSRDAQSRIAPPTTGTINIGWSGDKSGPTVASQAPALDGLQSYIRMINDAGGVKGNRST